MKSFTNTSRTLRGCIVVAGLGLSFGSTSARAQTVTDYSQGWIEQGGSWNGGSSTANTFAGSSNGSNYNDFFAFNLAGVTPGSVTGATLNVSGGSNEFEGSGTYNVYLSTIDPSVSPSDYGGLVSGSLIGTVSNISGGADADNIFTSFSITLNSTGVADINSLAGGDFIVGGAFSGGTPNPTGHDAVFGGSGENSNTLTLVTSAAPEPSTWALMLGGLGLLAFSYRRKFKT